MRTRSIITLQYIIAYFAVFSYVGMCLRMYCFVDSQITGTINIKVQFSIKVNLLSLAKSDGTYRVTQLTLNDFKGYRNA